MSLLKIAVCISGQLRTAVEVYPIYKKFLGNYINTADVFIHTWDIDGESPHVFSQRPKDISTYEFRSQLTQKSKINKVISLYKPKVYIVGSYEEFIKNSKVMIPWLYSLSECNKLKINYEKQNNFIYDVVLRHRFDSVYDLSHTIEEEISSARNINSNTVYTLDFMDKLNTMNRFEDVAWLANSSVMNKVCEFADVRLTWDPIIGKHHLDWQDHHWQYLKENKILMMPWKTKDWLACRTHHIDKYDILNFKLLKDNLHES